MVMLVSASSSNDMRDRLPFIPLIYDDIFKNFFIMKKIKNDTYLTVP